MLRDAAWLALGGERIRSAGPRRAPVADVPARTHISAALADLGLPFAIARRLGRALDRRFTSAGIDTATLRCAVTDAAAVLLTREPPALALQRLRAAIAAHGEEVGYRGRSVLAPVARSELLAAEYTAWAAAAHGLDAPTARLHTLPERWQEHARAAIAGDTQRPSRR